ncbi:protein O-mannosyl-transferase 2-like isoform X2 [Pomacea canaliculata]|uniref:protein O-mannosyl-transferase 2-like isoform X2 n=1 Tax=Pomacea canaliculata TaxID=400727 RepID=UPI000D73EA08|nr:protein O-mannosyl-transferase 2-like isoform X2 [Pomacea canaliculata]
MDVFEPSLRHRKIPSNRALPDLATSNSNCKANQLLESNKTECFGATNLDAGANRPLSSSTTLTVTNTEKKSCSSSFYDIIKAMNSFTRIGDESGDSNPNKGDAEKSDSKTEAQSGKEFSSIEEISTHYKTKSMERDKDCISNQVNSQNATNIQTPRAYYPSLLVFSVTSLLLRLHNIETPAHICWDETHFGKMGSWYINRTFFFDVHPPLGKMLIGLAGYLTGYDGSFSFAKPGDEYGDTPYMGMRVFCAILGAALVPMTFQIIWQFTSSILPAIFAASFVLFDVGTNTLSRYILLDPILMFFILAATYCKLRVLNLRKCWWFWLTATGVSLAGAMGVKFVGLFVVLLVGVLTARDLNMLLSDLTLAMNHLIKHLIARIICLITVPFICYLLFFHIHFKVLNHSGSGDGFFSSAFQSQLIGNKLYNVSMPENVAFGSIITLKQRRIGGAYLHSHPHLYPEDHPPRQQQVTTYSHKDDNNLWKVKPADQDVDSSETVTLLKSGDLVRLEHVMTQRNLHSHREPAPLSKRHYQVSGYGVKGTGDANDIWLVEVAGATPGSLVQTVRSRIRFVHYYVRCALFSHEKKLPKWGWEQLEATCTTNIRDPRAQWSVEEVHDNRLPNVSFDLYSPSFLEKFLESHAVMSQGNSGLKPKEGEITSRPWQWPINYRGQIFSGKEHRIYLLGNPVLFWSALVLKALFFVCYLIHTIRKKRGSKIDPTLLEYNDRMFRTAWWLLLAWGLHYLPFWFMSRVLYFHHYFPAFLFSAMFCGVMLDYVVRQVCLLVPDGLHVPFLYSCMISFMGLIVYSFYLFHPLAYGMQGNPPSAEGGMMEGLHWLESWDF